MTPLADCGHQGSDSGLIRVKARTIPCGECYEALLARLKKLEAVGEALKNLVAWNDSPRVYVSEAEAYSALDHLWGAARQALAALEQP